METEEWIEDDEGVAAQHARARNLLPKITQQVKQALHEASIARCRGLACATTVDISGQLTSSADLHAKTILMLPVITGIEAQ
jgi:hypothetical protein